MNQQEVKPPHDLAPNVEIQSLLPQEQTGYFNTIQRNHFDRQTAVGSYFTEVATLRDLLHLAQVQGKRLSRDDDRQQFIDMDAPPSALSPECRYLMVETPGKMGIVRAEDLPDDTTVRVVRTKQGVPCSLVVENVPLTDTDFATIIIGPNEKERPEDPEPSTEKMIWTVHPGPPVRPATADIWNEGSTITIKDIKDHKLLGSTTWLKIVNPSFEL